MQSSLWKSIDSSFEQSTRSHMALTPSTVDEEAQHGVSGPRAPQTSQLQLHEVCKNRRLMLLKPSLSSAICT